MRERRSDHDRQKEAHSGRHQRQGQRVAHRAAAHCRRERAAEQRPSYQERDR
jgi:hypothetical protein